MDIIAGLVQLPQLVLISAVSFGNPTLSLLSVKDIGRQLGVNHVLDGGIRRAGQRIRITARLVEAASGRQVWAKRFDGTLNNMFAVQDRITQEILIALDVHLVTGKVGRILRQALADPDAIESYYRGWGALFRSSPADLYLAQEMAAETIRLAPDSPLGYTLAAFSDWWAVARKATEAVDRTLNRAAEMARHAQQGRPDGITVRLHTPLSWR
ncbi:MAG TPA: hypothetical protein VLT88_11630 [Desulfosarcina sp.]|nr:hypothetical protein [Desulfosarcina sp.]